MRIGILETGEISAPLAEKYHSYSPMFRRLLDAAGGDLDYETWRVVAGEMPDDPEACDGWIVSGSRHGVYEDHPWIEPLKTFLRDCLARRVPVVGVCFGHQILAAAMGGTVIKSDKGWGVGVHDYTVLARPAWMEGLGERFANYAVHQDQVIAPPPDTTVLASSPFCEYAALAYGDPEAPIALTVQPHPEFEADYVGDALRTRIGSSIETELGEAALQSLSLPVNNADWARWMVRFLRDAAARRAA